LLTPDVIVEVSRSIVVFQCQGRIERVEPVLWISGEGRQQRMIAVGARPVPTQSAKRIELFGSDWNGRSNRERLEFLAVFWRYSLSKVIGRKLFIRPGVSVRDLSTLPSAENDDFRRTITRALEIAGVHEVKWRERTDV
jgi:hypothetical protein